MKNRLMLLNDKLLLRKRFLIETVNDQLKNQSQIEHSRHRSPLTFVLNVLAGLIAYLGQPKKPAINWSRQDIHALALVASLSVPLPVSRCISPDRVIRLPGAQQHWNARFITRCLVARKLVV